MNELNGKEVVSFLGRSTLKFYTKNTSRCTGSRKQREDFSNQNDPVGLVKIPHLELSFGYPVATVDGRMVAAAVMTKHRRTQSRELYTIMK
jgi:hypothetical protein